ncbi:MAG: type I glyceraldehyde-3-phosphate dehydrogenase [Pseudomonadales bacterium]
MSDRKIRLGIMGFGQIGRQIYHLVAERDEIEIVAISDIGKPEILHYLLDSASIETPEITLQGNYLVNPKFKTRMMQTDRPAEVPWDLWQVDMVIDATGRFQSRANMQAHLDNGAPRVLISTLPADHIDRLIIPGINEDSASSEDRMLSAGSATTTALGLVLKVLSDRFGIEHASMTSVHAYTSDQPLQDYAGKDYRRSRSAAENIIPNTIGSAPWVEKILPQLAGKLSGYALNVPVQRGSLLDLNIAFESSDVEVEDVNNAMIEAKRAYPGSIDITEDPIVSSDAIGNRHSVLFDLKGTLKGGRRMVKTLTWYESLGHACRMLDVVKRYDAFECIGGETCA